MLIILLAHLFCIILEYFQPAKDLDKAPDWPLIRYKGEHASERD